MLMQNLVCSALTDRISVILLEVLGICMGSSFLWFPQQAFGLGLERKHHGGRAESSHRVRVSESGKIQVRST